MVRIEKYHPYKKNGYIYTYGEEISCCPDCGRKMYVHGTCRRKVRAFEDPDGTTLILRVLICRSCRKTHRELPDFISAYKRYSTVSPGLLWEKMLYWGQSN